MKINEKELEELILQVENDCMLPAPKHMKKEVLERSRRVDYQLAREMRQFSKNIQLLFYSLKVGAAVAAALLTLFLAPNRLPQPEQEVSQTAVWEEEVSLGEKLNQELREANQLFSQLVWGLKRK